MSNFLIESKLNKTLGRTGTIKTVHGTIKTPAFIPVGTNATVKSVLPEHIKQIGAEAILSNAYHLYLQPGDKIVKQGGGLGSFMNWQGPTFTDSGGFQVLSLGSGYKKVLAMEIDKLKTEDIIQNPKQRLAHIDDDGVTFKSHIDGSMHRWSPEVSMEVQWNIGADIIFAFDECTTLINTKEYQIQACDRTYKWAKRCIKKHNELDKDNVQQLFGVIQGAQYEDLRKQASLDLSLLDFDGFGIGGAIQKHILKDIVKWCNTVLPENKPKHLLGIGEIDDIFVAVEMGIDTFDCVMPSRLARHGTFITKTGKKHLAHGGFKTNFNPVAKDCKCYTCSNYSASYINHLFKSKEILASTLTTIHNEYFLVNLVANIRKSINDGSFYEFKNEILSNFYG
jgi:queuine tRNA-ribosyltransferase